MENLKIETSRNVDLEYEIAGLGERILAFLIDSAVIGVVSFIVIMFATFVVNNDTIRALMLVGLMIFILFYHLLMELLFNGQSLGKKARKIKVLKIDGTAPTLGNYLLRWVLRPVDISISSGSIALFSIILTDKGQRLGDIAAKTTVVNISNELDIKDTIYVNVNDAYEPVYKEASKLNDEDVTIIKEILIARTELEATDKVIEASYTVKEIFEKKMGITSDQHPIDFFNTLVKDYNKIHGVVN